MAISCQRPTTNIKTDMVCVKLIEITEWILILFWYVDNIVMLIFILLDLSVLQKIEFPGLDSDGTFQRLCL